MILLPPSPPCHARVQMQAQMQALEQANASLRQELDEARTGRSAEVGQQTSAGADPANANGNLAGVVAALQAQVRGHGWGEVEDGGVCMRARACASMCMYACVHISAHACVRTGVYVCISVAESCMQVQDRVGNGNPITKRARTPPHTFE